MVDVFSGASTTGRDDAVDTNAPEQITIAAAVTGYSNVFTNTNVPVNARANAPVNTSTTTVPSTVPRPEPPICRIARGMSGCEKNGNRGYWPERWNKHVRNTFGSPYCAAAVSFLLDSSRARAPTVRSGLARSFRTADSFSALEVMTGKRTVPSGCIIGWNLGKTINGHLGISMEDWQGRSGLSWQANSTFAQCSSGRGVSERDGGGWGIKTARIEPYSYLRITWFTPIVH